MPQAITFDGGDGWPVKKAGELSSCGHRFFLIEVWVSVFSFYYWCLLAIATPIVLLYVLFTIRRRLMNS